MDNIDEMTLKRLYQPVYSFEEKKRKAFSVLNKNVQDNETQQVLSEELENVFDILSNISLKIEFLESDNRFINLLDDNEIVGVIAIGRESLEYYFTYFNESINFKIKKQTDKIGDTVYVKNIHVEGKDKGEYSSKREERELSEITKMVYDIYEVINADNQITEQNFILKEASQDVFNIEDEYLAIEFKELYLTEYEARLTNYGIIRAHCECPRGISSAESVKDYAKLPKSKVEYKEDYLPFSLLSNLEFLSKRLLCDKEFKGFKVNPIIDECDDKYIFLAKVNLDLALEDEEIEYIPESVEFGPHKEKYEGEEPEEE